MTTTRTERRVARSPWASEALGLQLQHTTLIHGLDSMVLADAAGNLWAASQLDRGRAHLASTVADTGSLGRGGRFTIARQRGRSVTVRRLRVGRATLFLAAEGQQPRCEKALDQARPGVERILTGIA